MDMTRSANKWADILARRAEMEGTPYMTPAEISEWTGVPTNLIYNGGYFGQLERVGQGKYAVNDALAEFIINRSSRPYIKRAGTDQWLNIIAAKPWVRESEDNVLEDTEPDEENQLDPDPVEILHARVDSHAETIGGMLSSLSDLLDRVIALETGNESAMRLGDAGRVDALRQVIATKADYATVGLVAAALFGGSE